jgi:ProP effector
MTQRTNRARALLTRMLETFPVIRQCRPLKIGIHADLIPWAEAQGYDRLETRIALALHTARTGYLKAMAKGGARFDLAGLPAGEVTVEQQAHAAERLKAKEAAKARRQARLEKAAENSTRKEAEAKALPPPKPPGRPVLTLKRKPSGEARP